MAATMDVNATETLEEAEAQKIETGIPVLCAMGLLVLVGTIGNSLVIFTYYNRIQKSSTNLFIFCLAVFDITNCCLTLPMEIYGITNPFTNDNHALCAIHKFIAFAADLSSGYIIVCISFDRYLRIARPHQGLSIRNSKIAVVSVSIGASIVSSTCLLIYGTSTVDIPTVPGASGKKCGITPWAKGTVAPLVFNVLVLLCFLVGLIVLVTIYTRLGIKVSKWNKARIPKSDRQSMAYTKGRHFSEESSSKNDSSTEQPKWSDTYAFPPIIETENAENQGDEADVKSTKELSKSLDKNGFEQIPVTVSNTQMNGSKTLPLSKSSSFRQNQEPVKLIPRKSSVPAMRIIKKRIRLTKTTFMFIAAAVVYIISHVPYVIIKIVFILKSELKDTMSPEARMLVKFAEFSFIISYGVNPVIYGFMNPKFRKECQSLVGGLVKTITCTKPKFYLR